VKIRLKAWFGVYPTSQPSFWCISTVSSFLSMKLWPRVLWNFFSAMVYVWPKLDVSNEIYGYFSKPCWFLSFLGEKNLWHATHPIFEFWFWNLDPPKILWTIFFPMKIFSQNFDLLRRSYDCFTHNYNDPKYEIHIKCTIISLLDNLHVSPSEVASRQSYRKISKMTLLGKKKPMICALILNVMIQM